MEWTPKKIVMAIFFVIIIIVSVIILAIVIMDNTFLFGIIKTYFILPLLRIRFWAVIIFLLLMIVQSLIAPIPSELILLSGAMVFGLWGGIILGLIGSMLSGTIAYYVSKQGGRAILEAASEKLGLIDKFVMLMDEWISRWGIWAIIVGRAIPVVMFDPVSYASGISNIKPKHYLIATFIGSIPRAVFYSILGTEMLGGRPASTLETMTQMEFEIVANQFNTIFLVIFAILISMLVFANILVFIREKKKVKISELKSK